jgi:hypothetical protein
MLSHQWFREGLDFRGREKTRSGAALKGRDFQSRRKGPIISTTALAVEKCHYTTAPRFHLPGITWAGRPADHRYRLWVSSVRRWFTI